MLLGCDEASGVNDVVFKPLLTTLTGKCNFMVIIFNPNRNTGFAIETQTRLKEHFLCYQISALESTLITEDHIDNMRKFYEDDPNGWRVNVLGLPPEDEADALIPYSKIIEAADREHDPSIYSHMKKVAGFDVGGGSDLSAIAPVQGPNCAKIYTFSSSQESEIERFAVNTCENEMIERISVDGIGIGFFMPGMLRKHGINAKKTDSRNTSPDPKYANMRAYLFWRLRNWIINGGSIPNDKELIKELAILKKEEKGNKMFIISKAKLKKDGIKSHNKADALMLAMDFNHDLEVVGQVEVKKDKYRDKYSPQKILSWLAG
jgi:hypothetical protein